MLITDTKYFATIPVDDERAFTIPIEAIKRMLKAKPGNS